MNRGISFALQTAGMLLVCLAATVNDAEIAFGSTHLKKDTAYYFNENGKLLYRDTLALAPAYYVIKTCQTEKQIFYDWFGRDTTTQGGNFNPADVKNITESDAREVERLIRSSNIKDTLVKKYILKIQHPEFLRKIWERIPDSGKSNNPKRDYREYGGVMVTTDSVTFQRGKRSNPSYGGAAVVIKGNGIGYYHSHPSGEKNKGKDTFIQGPSMEDQTSVEMGKLSYVFGMNKRSHRLYILDTFGIQATLPFCWFLCCAVN